MMDVVDYSGEIKSITSLITPFSKIISEHTDSISILPDNLLVNLESLVKKHILEIHDSYKKELDVRDFAINKLQTRVNDLECKAALRDLTIDKLKVDIDNNEQYSRRHSLRIYGMEKKNVHENAENVLNKVFDEMDRLDSPIDVIEVDRAHRTGKAYKDNNGKWQQSVLLKFVSWNARNGFYKSRFHSKFFMTADLTKRKEKVFNYAREQINVESSLANKLIKYVYADVNCALIAFTSTGRLLRFNTIEEFNAILLYIENNTRSSEKIYAGIEEDWANL